MRKHLTRILSPRCFSSLPVVSHKFLLSGKRWEFSRGLLAPHADSAALVHFGDTAVLAAFFSDNQQNCSTQTNGIQFTTDYSEKQHISTDPSHNYYLRSARHFEKFSLISRSIDRTMRPILPPLTHPLNLTCVLLASDGIHDPEIAAINAASAALSLTNTPGMPTCAAVRMGRVHRSWVINPNRRELSNSQANYIVSCTKDGISMIQGHSNELSLPLFCEMLTIAQEKCSEIINRLDLLKGLTNPTFSILSPTNELPSTLYPQLKNTYFETLKLILSSPLSKLQRGKQSQATTNLVKASAIEIFPSISVSSLEQIRTDLHKEALRENIMRRGIRPGARGCKEIRELSASIGPIKAAHGSAIFQRGETQILSSLSLLPPYFSYDVDTGSEVVDTCSVQNFYLRYSNPDYAVREAKSRGMPTRRELGHSRLAESAFLHLLPSSFPFSLSLFCDVQSSSGSSSMTSICAASLAMLDGGVPLKSVVAGVATGLMLDKTNSFDSYTVLSDIQGIEDALGNMDLKVGGTRNGITACQLDIKEINGIPMNLMRCCLERSWEDRHQILDFMEGIISSHKRSAKLNAPVSSVVFKQDLSSPGLITKIRKIQEALGVFTYTLSPNQLYLYGETSQKHSEVLKLVHSLLEKQDSHQLEFGALYRSRVVEVRPYGLLVQLYATQEEPTLVHTSQLHPAGILANSLEFKVDDIIIVKYFGVEPVSGRLRVSRKAAMCPYEKEPIQLL